MKLKEKDLVNLAFKEEGLLSKQFKGYSVREQQVELATKIQESIKNSKHLLGEGPTGVGKSLAALIPAFETIVRDDAPVIVVTSSIILQEQYFYKDIPLLEKLFDYDTGAVLIKGRSNYLCLSKLNEFKAGNFVNSSNKYQGEIENILRWSKTTKKGDVSELDFVPSYPAWSQFAAMNNHECLRKECPLYNQCHYYAQRKKVSSSKLVICNYHYFFNAINNEGMLPDGAKVVIMDEGHEIASIGRDFLETKYNSASLKDVYNSFLKTFKAVERSGEPIDIYKTLDGFELDLLQSSLDESFIYLTNLFYQKKPQNRESWTLGIEERKGLKEIVNKHYLALKTSIKSIEHYLEYEGLDQEQRMYWNDIHTEEEIKWQVAIENLYDELIERKKFLNDFVLIENQAKGLLGVSDEETEEKNDNSVVYWIDLFQGNSVTLHRKPSSCSELTGPLFDRDWSVVILSATLAVGSEFSHLRSDLGIEEETNELVVPSPFNLTDNMFWYLPHGVPAGNAPEHQMFMMEEMLKVIKELHGRTLCLFTSNKNLITATNHFRKILPDTIQVLAQGELPKQRLIDAIKENPNTVIMGTRSFFTGVDIQGQNLSAVLIDKLPFPMIGDPVNDYLMTQERGFWTYTLPETIISLKQGFGRLNRTSNDKGIVAIYDGRIASSASYKNRIFNSFDFKVTATRDWEQVRDYINKLEL